MLCRVTHKIRVIQQITCPYVLLYCSFFFFQAEDGIRAFHVTGVQTCALPISYRCALALPASPRGPVGHALVVGLAGVLGGLRAEIGRASCRERVEISVVAVAFRIITLYVCT